MMSMSAVPPSMGSVSEETREPVRYAAMMSRSLKARSCAVSLAIRISDSRVTRIKASLLPVELIGQGQCLLERRQFEALPDAVLDQLQMLRGLDNVQAICLND